MPSFEITSDSLENQLRLRTGGKLLDLLSVQEQWLYRRIEHLCFDDDRTIGRRTECDITLEQVGVGAVPTIPGDRVLLPIAMHPRWPARHVIVKDARTGEPLPFLTRREERQLVAAGLTAWSYEVVGPRGSGFESIPADVRYRRLLSDIEPKMPTPPIGAEWAERLNAVLLDDFAMCMRDYWVDFVDYQLIVAMPELDHVAPERSGARRPNRFRVMEEHAEELTERPLSSRTMEWAADPATAWTIYNCTHDRQTAKPAAHVLPWSRPLQRDDVRVTIPASLVVEGDSFHFAFTAPEGVYIDYGRLVVTMSSTQAEGPPGEIIEIEDDDPHWDVAHFWFTLALSQLDQPEVVDSTVILVFRPMYHGVMRSGVITSWLTTSLLGLLLLTAGYAGTGWTPLFEVPMVDRDTNSVVSLLLVVPSIVLAVLIRVDEHVFTKAVLEQYRRRLAAVAVTTFLVGVLFAVGFSGVLMFVVLLLATGLAGALSRSLQLAAIASLQGVRAPQRSARKPWRKDAQGPGK